MNLLLIRFVFTVFSALFFGFTAYNLSPENEVLSFAVGSTFGLIFAGILFSLSHYIRNWNIRSMNVASIGLLFGGFLGYTIVQVLNGLGEITSPELFSIVKPIVYLVTCYLGLTLTAQAADEINFCIPFLKFNPSERNKKDILLDPSLLSDTRLFDLAKSGLLDHQLLIPRFALEDLQAIDESSEDYAKAKALNGLEVLKKLEGIPGLEPRIINHDPLDARDLYTKLIRLARRMNANILTGDISKIQQSELDEIKVININLLSQALKPLTSAGEFIQIKIQRFGKEPRQGVGYLDDGTMVVVNGGAEYIGKTIKVVVLSIKPTSSGRMIFCNTLDITEELEDDLVPPDLESAHNPYY